MALETELHRIRRDNPQRYGILRHNFSGVYQAITRCDRNYPEARQLYTLLDDSEISPRTFGNVLALLAELDVIKTRNERTNRNRYDLTQCHPETLTELGELLSSSS